jgi:ABC-type molybdate transport system substrate-binding protein
MRIMQGKSDGGVTWASEVRFQEKIGNPIKGVPIPADQNTTVYLCRRRTPERPNREVAAAWVAYLNTPAAQAIYREFGFGPAVGDNK